MVSLYKLKDTELTPLINLAKQLIKQGIELQYNFTEQYQTIKLINQSKTAIQLINLIEEAFNLCDLTVTHYTVKLETLDITALELQNPNQKSTTEFLYITTLELHQVEYIIPKGIQTL